ncbi:histidine--tRNA ligase [Peptoniphilaceae bacterium SGI.131]
MTIVNPSILPGFLELLPEDQKKFDKLRAIIEENFKKYGFVNLDTALIEKEEILLSKGGGETSKQIYRIAKESTAQALRFDLTVSLARFVAMHAHELNFPFRRYQIGKVYRGERNQKGRYREFYQCDIDIIGNDKLSLLNDAEIPSVIYNIFKDMGFEELSFHINNRKLINGFLYSLGVADIESCLRTIDKLAKIGKENTCAELISQGLEGGQADKIFEFLQESSNETLIERAEALCCDNESFIQGLRELKDLYVNMQKFGVDKKNIKIDFSITRGLDYYTGSVFETFLNGYEAIGSVCSGGRYEDLASNFSKQKFPGIGLSIGLTRLYYQFSQAGILDELLGEGERQVLVLPFSEADMDYAIEIVNELRKNNITSQLYSEDGKMKKKFAYADKLNVAYSLIVGENERLDRSVAVKNMSTGLQENVKIDRLIDYILEG